MKTPDEMAAAFADLPEALASTLEVADMCDLKLHWGATLLPPFDVPDGLKPDQYLTKLVEEGLKWRYGGEPSAAAKDRAANELEVIKATGYASYFLIVWDFYNFARKHDIVVGPGRGSAAGSLVSYCLGITNLDPLKHGLIFERFLNIDRVSMPDIDCDFSVEGRNVSTHAAGVVIAPEPLVRYTPLQHGPKSEAVITQYDMKAVGDIGLLKIDFLGLQNLDIIATCARLVREHRGIDIDLDAIPFDDAKTYELLSAGDTHGVFQLEGAGMRRMLMAMRPQSFGDVSAAVPRVRPGPMVNIPAVIARKQGREPIEYMHERLEPILRETYGVMIYQEQVMMAARELAGFTMSEADILRAAMGKKDKPKMAKLRTKFTTGAVERGISDKTAETLFDGIAKFAEYGFNRAHSAADGGSADQNAFLKAK